MKMVERLREEEMQTGGVLSCFGLKVEMVGWEEEVQTGEGGSVC